MKIFLALVFILFSIFGCDSNFEDNNNSSRDSKSVEDSFMKLEESFNVKNDHISKDFKGHNIEAISKRMEDNSWRLEPHPSDRGEFETVEEYNKRVNEFVPLKTVFGISSPDKHYWAFIVPGYQSDIKYDIDRKIFNIKVPKLFFNLSILNKTLDRRNYTASNAFGAQVDITKETNVWYEIRFDKERALAFRDLSGKESGFSRSIPMPLEEAKNIKPFLDLIVIGTPLPPWHEKTGYTKDATLDDREAVESTTHRLYLNLQELWLVNTLTGDIYAKWSKVKELSLLSKAHPFVVEIKYKGNAWVDIYVDDNSTSETIRSRVIPKTKLFEAKHRIKLHSYNSKDEISIFVNGAHVNPEWTKTKTHYEYIISKDDFASDINVVK